MSLLLVPDTNVFVQFQAFDGFPWKEIAGHEDVVVVVLTAVIRELDKLKLEAIRTTLRRVTSACEPHTVLLFDHVPAPSPSAAPNKSHAFVANLGERFGWGTDDALPMLFEEGFRHAQSLTFDEICLTFTGTYDAERGFHARRMVVASKSPPPRP